MKIVYLHQYFNTPAMDGGTRSFELGRRLGDLGHEVHVITSHRLRDGRRRGFETVEGGMRVHWLPVPYSNEMGYASRIRAFLSFALRASTLATRIASDVVFATSTPLTIAIPALVASRLRSTPMVFEVRDLWPDVPIAVGALNHPVAIRLARVLERVAYSGSQRIVALSPGMKEGVEARGYPADRIHVIPNACDLDTFAGRQTDGEVFRNRHAWLGNRKLVVYTGTLGLVNGVDFFARIAFEASMIDPEIRFLVVGRGSQWDEVRQTALATGVLDRNFFMLGSVPKQQVPAILAAADLATSFVIDLPALWANSANKFFDALASSTPIAINYRGWQADLLEQRGAGVVVHPTDPTAAARSIVDILHDPERLRHAGTQAGRLARAQFHRDDLAVAFEHVLKSAVDEWQRR